MEYLRTDPTPSSHVGIVLRCTASVFGAVTCINYSLNAPGFNGNGNAGIPPDKNTTLTAQPDVILHF